MDEKLEFNNKTYLNGIRIIFLINILYLMDAKYYISSNISI